LALDAGLSHARSRIERHHEWYGVLVLDLDRFKAINDALGHLRGDEVLRATGEALRRVLRAGDTAYRYGGEEFVVVLRVTGPSDVFAAAERIRRAIEDLQIPNPANIPFGYVTTSVGATSIGPGDAPADDESWLTRADAELYRAKANGRNRCEVGPDRHRSLARRPGVERHLPAQRVVTVAGPR
jgi:diguanylate cyclase (GGDEF)-like protein